MGAAGRFVGEDGLRSLTRPERLAALTRLRVVLIGWVVLYHLELVLHALSGVPVVGAVVLKGYLGVDGFFVLSGFALFLGYRHRPPTGWGGWAEFARRRAERIFPLHLLSLALLAALVGIGVAAGVAVNDPQRFGPWEFATQALLVHAWETTSTHAWNYPSWALSAIWAGYLVFPLLLWPLLRARPGSCWLLVLGALAGLAVLSGLRPGVQLNHTLHLGLLRFALDFVLGLALARLVTARAVDPRRAVLGAALLPLGLAGGQDVLVVAGMAALVARLGMEAPGRTPPTDLMWRLGEASFGVYLCWIFVEAALVLALRAAAPDPAMRILLMGAGLAATLALGWAAWRWVETPAARWLKGAPRAA